MSLLKCPRSIIYSQLEDGLLLLDWGSPGRVFHWIQKVSDLFLPGCHDCHLWELLCPSLPDSVDAIPRLRPKCW